MKVEVHKDGTTTVRFQTVRESYHFRRMVEDSWHQDRMREELPGVVPDHHHQYHLFLKQLNQQAIWQDVGWATKRS